MMSRRYRKRDLDELEPYYSLNLSAMTAEGLHSKSDIAAELAWRDAGIEQQLTVSKSIHALATGLDAAKVAVDQLTTERDEAADKIEALEHKNIALKAEHADLSNRITKVIQYLTETSNGN